MLGIPYQNLDLALLPQYPCEIPVILQSLKQFLVHNGGYQQEGILRVVGTEISFHEAMDKLDMGYGVNELQVSCYVIGQLIKAFFREYPVPSPGFFPHAFLNATDNEQLITQFKAIEEPHRSMVLWMIDFCLEIAAESEANKMNIEAIAVCVSANFLRHEDRQKLFAMQKSVQAIFKTLCELRVNQELQLPEFSFDAVGSGFGTGTNGSGKLNTDLIDIDINDEEEEKSNNNNSNSNSNSNNDSSNTNTNNNAYFQRRRSISRNRASPKIVYASSVSQLYKQSLYTGIYGSVTYPKRDTIIHSIERQSAIHSKEILLQATGVHYNSRFQLSFATDDDSIDIGLTTKELSLMDTFNKNISSHHNYDVPRSELVRFVIGCKQRLAVAEKRFLNLKGFERLYHLNDVHLRQVRDELRKPQYMLCGTDIKNHAIIGFKISHFAPKTSNLAVMMKAVYTWMDAITSDIMSLRNGVVLILDMGGLTMDNMSLDLEKLFIKAFQERYPVRMSKIIIVNAPMIVRAGIKVAKLFLKKKMSARINSVKVGNDLWKLVDKSQVPQCIGGTFNVDNQQADGQQVLNAWSFVCTKISGNLHNTQQLGDIEEEVEVPLEEENSGGGGAEEEKAAAADGVPTSGRRGSKVSKFGHSMMSFGSKAKSRAISAMKKKNNQSNSNSTGNESKTNDNELIVESKVEEVDDAELEPSEVIYRPEEDMAPPKIASERNPVKRLGFKKRTESVELNGVGAVIAEAEAEAEANDNENSGANNVNEVEAEAVVADVEVEVEAEAETEAVANDDENKDEQSNENSGGGNNVKEAVVAEVEAVDVDADAANNENSSGGGNNNSNDQNNDESNNIKDDAKDSTEQEVEVEQVVVDTTKEEINTNNTENENVTAVEVESNSSVIPSDN